MAINTVNQSTKTTNSADKIFNPNSKLDKEAFMKLFLKELEMQDPTDPMDSGKMLEQTAYLSTMEMNQNMQQTLTTLSKSLDKNSALGAVEAIGKMGDTGQRYINVTDDDKKASFDLYFGNDIQSGTVYIKDKYGNTVKTIPIDAHTKGVLNFDWDLTNSNGQRVPNNTYEVTAEYTSPDGQMHKSALGAYPIESVKFENGETYVKMGGNYYPLSQVKEIYEWNG